MIEQLRYYVAGQASSWPVYILEQLVLACCSWVPTIVGIGLRGLAYRLIMKLNGMPAIERPVSADRTCGSYFGYRAQTSRRQRRN